MNNKELRIAVAKALGWEFKEVLTSGKFAGKDPDGVPGFLPDYLNDINICMTLIDIINQYENPTYYTKISINPQYKDTNLKYVLQIYEHDDYYPNDIGELLIMERGRSLSEMICKAFLRWKEEIEIYNCDEDGKY